MPATIAIIGALEKEVRQIYHEIEHATVAEDAGLTVVGGEYAGFNLVATVAGMGTVNSVPDHPLRGERRHLLGNRRGAQPAPAHR